MIKIPIIVFISMLSLNVFSQELTSDKIFISDSLTGESGKYYMEGKEIDLNKTILDFRNIEKIESYFGKSSNIHSGSKGAYLIVRKSKTELIPLQKLIEEIKAGNESIKYEKNIKVVIDGIFISDIFEYKIEPSCILKINILLNDSKGVNREINKPVIAIETNRDN